MRCEKMFLIFLQIFNLSIQSTKRKISCLEANLDVTDEQTSVKIFNSFFVKRHRVRIKPCSHLNVCVCVCFILQECVLWQHIDGFILNICIWRQRSKKNANVKGEQGFIRDLLTERHHLFYYHSVIFDDPETQLKSPLCYSDTWYFNVLICISQGYQGGGNLFSI